MINTIKNRGESLTEVLVAVGVLVIVLVTSFVLINRGVATNISVKNKIIAINIAREGLEGVRNVRDTNWIKYSGNRRNRWLCVDEVNTNTDPNTIDDCADDIIAGEHIVDFNQNFQRFFLQPNTTQANNLDLESGISDFSDYRLYRDSDSRYTHVSTGNDGTIFYRQIILTPQDEPDCGTPSLCAGGSSERLLVVSRVQWVEPLIAGEDATSNELVGSIVLETYLYDYLGRDSF